MANLVKHRFASGKADGPDATQVQPSHWNDGHAFSGGNAGDLLTRDPTDATYGATWAPPATGLPPGGNLNDLLMRDASVATYGAKWAPGTSAYLPYTPSFGSTGTAPTIGNGTLIGRWWRNGPTIFFAVRMTWGSTSTPGTGGWYYSLPVAAESASSISCVASGVALDLSAGNIASVIVGNLIFSGSNGLMIPLVHTMGLIGAGVPFVWADGDSLQLTGFYYVAAGLFELDASRPTPSESSGLGG